MTIRFTAGRVIAAVSCGAALLTAPTLTAPPAGAACNAGQTADPFTGVCWSQSATTLGISGTGGTCLPGRLGLCLGALQNSQIPGANLRPMPAAGPAPRQGSWP